MNPRFMSFIGLLTMIGIAHVFSNNRKAINYRIVVGGLVLQFILAFIILKTAAGREFFSLANTFVSSIINISDEGARFVFGEDFRHHMFAFKILPTIIFISALSSILFYYGVIQKIVEVLAWVMVKVMNISGSESLVTAANIFLGQTEAPLLIKPYLKTLTRSEILTMMTGGMATVAGGVLAAYIGLGISAGHLLAASFMSAPAAIFLSKIIYPETEKVDHSKNFQSSLEVKDVNVFEAACSGASSGLQLALNVAAMLITFVALIALGNKIIGGIGALIGIPLTLEMILGACFRPVAFLMGVSWEESLAVGRLLGEKMVLNEFVAYIHLSEYMNTQGLSERAINISTYALCGFANFSSIAIQIGGIGAIEPSRKSDFARLGLRALLGGTLSGFVIACIAGIMT